MRINCGSTHHNSDNSLRTSDAPGVWRRANGLPISCKLADWTTWFSSIWNVFPLKFSSQIFIPRLLGSQFITKRNNWRCCITQKRKEYTNKNNPHKPDWVFKPGCIVASCEAQSLQVFFFFKGPFHTSSNLFVSLSCAFSTESSWKDLKI